MADEKPKLSFREQIEDLMSTNEVVLDPNRRDVILLLGITGVGKSTMANILFSELSAIESTYLEDDMYYDVVNTKVPPKTGSRTQSDTVCPQLFTDSCYPAVAIYDCPGLEDTRGTDNEIATGIYLANVLEFGHNLKLVVTVGYDSVAIDVDRSKFINKVVGGLLQFLVRLEGYQNSLLLLVTKYANPAEKNQGAPPDAIVKSIAKFLKGVQADAEKKYPERRADVSIMFQAWLSQNAEEKYSNIAFFRRVTDEGPLSGMNHVVEGKQRIRDQLFENDLFKMMPIDVKDFGSPVSDAAKLEIRNYREDLFKSIQGNLDTLVNNIKEKLVRSRSEVHRNFDYVLRFKKLINNLESPAALQNEESVSLMLKNFGLLLEFCNKIKDSFDLKYANMKQTLDNLNYMSRVDTQEANETWIKVNEKWNKVQLSLSKTLEVEDSMLRKEILYLIDTKLHEIVTILRELFSRPFSNHPTTQSISRQVRYFADFLGELEGVQRTFTELDEGQQNMQQPKVLRQCLSILEMFGNKVQVTFPELGSLEETLELFDKLSHLESKKASVTWDNVNSKWIRAVQNMEKDVENLSGLTTTFPDGIFVSY